THDTAHPDRGGGDHLDVDAGGGEHLEHPGRDAGVRLHAGADQTHPTDVLVDGDLARAELLADGREHLEDDVDLGVGHGEGDVGGAVVGHVLDDHVDVDVAVGERAEHPGRDTG